MGFLGCWLVSSIPLVYYTIVRLKGCTATFYLSASRMMGGLIRSGLPVQISQQGLQSRVAGRSGVGGTRIEVTGAWADFFVGTDSAGGTAPDSTTGVNPGEGR